MLQHWLMQQQQLTAIVAAAAIYRLGCVLTARREPAGRRLQVWVHHSHLAFEVAAAQIAAVLAADHSFIQCKVLLSSLEATHCSGRKTGRSLLLLA